MTGDGGSRSDRPLRYVALGDSYTIGTSVDPSERWPDQLVARLGGPAAQIRLVANLAVNGWTSRDVIERQLPRLEALRPGFLSLLVGVNDVVQGVPPERYAANLEAILDACLAWVSRNRIILVTTPDYTVTPAGADYGDPATNAAAIRVANATFAAAGARRGIDVVDIHDVSLRASADRTLVADDGLHPSGVQYRRWVDRIAPTVEAILGR